MNLSGGKETSYSLVPSPKRVPRGLGVLQASPCGLAEGHSPGVRKVVAKSKPKQGGGGRVEGETRGAA